MDVCYYSPFSIFYFWPRINFVLGFYKCKIPFVFLRFPLSKDRFRKKIHWHFLCKGYIYFYLIKSIYYKSVSLVFLLIWITPYNMYRFFMHHGWREQKKSEPQTQLMKTGRPKQMLQILVHHNPVRLTNLIWEELLHPVPNSL